MTTVNNTVTPPILGESKISADQWKTLLSEYNLTNEEAKTALKVRRFSEFLGDLKDAEKTIKAYLAESTDVIESIRAKYTQNIKGKDYLVVQGRILIFRYKHPYWSIVTEAVILESDAAVFRCTIADDEGHVISTGHGRAASADVKNLGGRFVEKAETAAIGRALALAGYGTDDSLDDSEYLSDSPSMANK